MITMKEQADQLRKILHHMGIPKKTTPEGIKIPYENLADCRAWGFASGFQGKRT